MPIFRLKANTEIDILNKTELDDSLKSSFSQYETAKLRGVRQRRLPQALQGKVSSNAISLGEGAGEQVGPESGYVWAVRRIVVAGLTAGTTPDVVNLTKSGVNGEILWQFTGNAFYAKFGRLELTLWPGETLALVNVGNLTATGYITVTGEVTEVAAELIGKLS